MSDAKTKVAAPGVPLPQDREQARAQLLQYGEAAREVARIEAQLNDDLAALKDEYLKKAAPFAVKAACLLEGLKMFCNANRATLTRGGKTKTVDLGTGKVSWRTTPAKIEIAGEADDVVERIQAAGDEYSKFLRQSFKPNKVEMLRDPNLASKIEGVTIVPAGEAFEAKPFADEDLAEAAQ